MKYPICFLLFLILAACNNNQHPANPCADNFPPTIESCEDVTAVSGDHCTIQQALVTDSAGNVIDKFVYHYDGTHYDEIDRYYSEEIDQPLPNDPTEIHHFTYQNGLVSEVSYTKPAESPGTTWQTTYTYENQKLKTQLKILHDGGATEFESEQDYFYITNPEDKLYYYDGGFVQGNIDLRALFEYKSGNLNRMASPSSEGSCLINNLKWHFIKNYFDDKPNVLTDFAVRYPFLIGKGIYGAMLNTYPAYPVEANANNITGRAENNGTALATTTYCWTFLQRDQDYYIKSFERKDPERTITYYYDCE